MLRLFRFSLALSLAALFGPAALADESHYQNFLLGERAAGMGGAYTAIADDPSATYYNPAGLVNAKSGILSANLNFYGLQQQSLANAFHVEGGSVVGGLSQSVGAAVSQLNTVPGTAGAVHGLGDPDATGHYRHAWALSVLVPDQTSGNVLAYVIPRATGNLSSLSETTFDQTVLVGLGYGFRFDDRWSFGASANAMYRQITRDFRNINAAGYGPNGPSTTFFEDNITLKLAVLGLYAQAGALYKLNSQWTFGATLASPSWTIYSTASTDEVQVSEGSAASPSGLTEVNQPNLRGDTRLPAHGRLGAAYQPLPKLLLTADFSLWAVVHYGLIDGASANQRLPSFVNGIDRQITPNFDLGVQYTFADKYPVRVGFFTNLSSAPALGPGPEPQLDTIDLYGFTVGFTLPGVHTESTFGVICSFGNGQSKTPQPELNGNVLAYATGPASQIFLDFAIGGSYRF